MEKAKLLELSAGSFNKREFQKLLNKFEKETVLLNLILKYLGVADLKNLSEDDVSTLKAGIEKCENDLEGLEEKVKNS